MNARELAILIRRSESTTSRLISGERRPSVSTMIRMRDALGWSIDEQAKSLDEGRYSSELKTRMENRGVRAARSATRS